ncbi:MAG: FAD-dependent oxidoreductase [Ignavibacteriales bacterium]|nr:FAD-dependent oxidoreductase [Ignavibacteriales bacterium]
MKKTILVVGGLSAGPSAAAKAKRVNPNADIILFEQGEFISYGICEIPYYISGEVADKQKLTPFSPQTFSILKGVTVKTFHRVEQIIPQKKILVVRDLSRGELKEYKYNSLILAIGSSTKKLNVENENARNAFHVKSLEDGFAIKKFVDENKPKKAIIIGGGYVGMEMAETLRRLNLQVTILHQRNLPMKGLENDTREKIVEQLSANGIEFVSNVKTESFLLGKNELVSHVFTNKGTFETDLVILSLGVEPNVSLAKSAKIRIGKLGGIITDTKQMTSVENIYACGDCCEVKNIVNGKPMLLPLATIASKQGWIAGENAAGGNAKFAGAIRAIALRLFDLEIAHVGISSDEAKESGFDVHVEKISTHNRISFMPESSRINIIGIFDKRSGRILGANLFGGEGTVLRANTLAVAIQHKLTVQDISDLDLAYAPLFSPLWDAVLVLGNATKKKLPRF